MIKFTKERVLLLYQIMVESTGGSFGIRDEKMLESAIEAPYHTFDGKDVYPTKLEKAARLGYGLIVNHPFIDGNKRIGVYVMLTFLEANGISIKLTNQEIEEIGLGVAKSDKTYEDILYLLKSKKS